jgi:hypothetical protein
MPSVTVIQQMAITMPKVKLIKLKSTQNEEELIEIIHLFKGIETWLSIYPSGIQMEHSSSSKNNNKISSLIFYPMKSLVYCGALRFNTITDPKYLHEKPLYNKPGKFFPLDSPVADLKENLVNPPLFVIFMIGIDPAKQKQIIECSLFVIGRKTIAMQLVESCQMAFSLPNPSVLEFYKKYGNIPVVFCLKDELLNDKKDKKKQISVKNFDTNGYFYATERVSIDWWQLFEIKSRIGRSLRSDSIRNIEKEDEQEEQDNRTGEEEESKNDKYADLYSKIDKNKNKNRNKNFDSNKNGSKMNETNYTKQDRKKPNDTDNLVSIEKHVDPETGQNIYIRWLAEPQTKRSNSPKKKVKIFEKLVILNLINSFLLFNKRQKRHH